MKKNFDVSRRADDAENISRVKEWLNAADAVIIGAGAGLSTSAGFAYSGGRFERYFADFSAKYGFNDMYSGGFYPYSCKEEFWAYWSRYIWINRYDCPAGKPYETLLDLVRDKNYFVLTTNVDHRFQVAGFDKNGCFTRRATTDCSSVPCLATTAHTTTKHRCARCWTRRKICAFRPNSCRAVPCAADL